MKSEISKKVEMMAFENMSLNLLGIKKKDTHRPTIEEKKDEAIKLALETLEYAEGVALELDEKEWEYANDSECSAYIREQILIIRALIKK